MNELSAPTTPRERALIAATLTTAGHGDLAIRLGAELEGDATSRQMEALRRDLASNSESLRKDIRMVLLANLIIVVVAMGLNAGMVGVSMSLKSGEGRSLDITPSGLDLPVEGPLPAMPSIHPSLPSRGEP